MLYLYCIPLPVHWDVVDVGKLVVSGRKHNHTALSRFQTGDYDRIMVGI